MSDAQDRYRLIAGGFDARVHAAPSNGWDMQSPCPDWKARDVVGHVVNNHRRLIGAVRRGEAPPMAAEENPEQAWNLVYETMLELSDDPDAMATSVEGPMGPTPLEELLGRFVSMDLLIHTWDLARAVGGDERLDDESVRYAYDAVKPLDAMIRQPKVFGPKLDPPPGADTQTQFLYFLGRRA